MELTKSKVRDMYEHLVPYYREHLAKNTTDVVLGRAPEDDPIICEEYKQILRTPGLGYEFMIEDINDMAHPVWEWKVNRRLYI